MNQTTTAIYENGLLRPISPLDLPEHSEVEITIHIGEDSLHSKVRKALQLENQSNKTEDVISNERRAELATIFSAEKPLSEYINEDRETQ
ncbi:MAG: antitoxin family protein [Acidobacteria bacterium]|jgi:predicted DNA-binding antitoxin AbrB/MazE fold protein|nr:antitoxin family protein [Acidobacteriota bacterium]